MELEAYLHLLWWLWLLLVSNISELTEAFGVLTCGRYSLRSSQRNCISQFQVIYLLWFHVYVLHHPCHHPITVISHNLLIACSLSTPLFQPTYLLIISTLSTWTFITTNLHIQHAIHQPLSALTQQPPPLIHDLKSDLRRTLPYNHLLHLHHHTINTIDTGFWINTNESQSHFIRTCKSIKKGGRFFVDLKKHTQTHPQIETSYRPANRFGRRRH